MTPFQKRQHDMYKRMMGVARSNPGLNKIRDPETGKTASRSRVEAMYKSFSASATAAADKAAESSEKLAADAYATKQAAAAEASKRRKATESRRVKTPTELATVRANARASRPKRAKPSRPRGRGGKSKVTVETARRRKASGAPKPNKAIPKRLTNEEFNNNIMRAANKGDMYARGLQSARLAGQEQSRVGPLFFRPIYNMRGRQIIVARHNGPDLFFSMDSHNDLAELARFAGFAGLDMEQMMGWAKKNSHGLMAQAAKVPGYEFRIGDMSFDPDNKASLVQIIRETQSAEKKLPSVGGGTITDLEGGTANEGGFYNKGSLGFDKGSFLDKIREIDPKLREALPASLSGTPPKRTFTDTEEAVELPVGNPPSEEEGEQYGWH